jgi:hypothetical protein
LVQTLLTALSATLPLVAGAAAPKSWLALSLSLRLMQGTVAAIYCTLTDSALCNASLHVGRSAH